ncbi:MAG: hypothetical protein ABI894_05235 [Ilumatobacteraceae bacterium]
MKTKVAMMISVAGVLVAGSAAALVNTQVLDSSATPTSLSIDAAQNQQAAASRTTDASVVPTTVATQAAPAIPAVAPSGTQVAYAIGSAGTVTLDTAGDVLRIVAITPADGWVVTESETDDSNNVEIKLQSGDQEAEFHANLLFGVVTVSARSGDDSVTSISVDDHGSDDNSGHGGDDDNGGGSDD